MLIVLSAKDSNRLIERASDLVAYLIAGTAEAAIQPRLLDVAYTLQIGREPMEERLAFLADTLESAIQKLTLFATGAAQITGLYRGRTPQKCRLIRQQTNDKLKVGRRSRSEVAT